MKLFIQIPCFNEENQLKTTLKDLPKKIPGISSIKILIIDDGSTDDTINVAKKNNVDYIVSHKINKGLAKAFENGLKSCIALGADIIVNTDADNQYKGSFIKDIVHPIINENVDICIGARPINKIKEFSLIKKNLQKIGSYVIRLFSGVYVEDATSGFRSFSKYAAMNINVVSKFTYTLDTILQAGRKDLLLKNVPIEVNTTTRKSRLFKSNLEYVKRSLYDIIYITAQLNPLKIFGALSLISFTIGFFIGFRFLILVYLVNENHSNGDYIQSLILCSVFLIFGGLGILLSLIANQISEDRNFIEKIIYKLEYSSNSLENNYLLKHLIYSKKKNTKIKS